MSAMPEENYVAIFFTKSGNMVTILSYFLDKKLIIINSYYEKSRNFE